MPRAWWSTVAPCAVTLPTNSVTSTLTLQRQPGEIAVDTSSHTLWITNDNDASLTLLDPDGKNPVVLAAGNGPAGVAIDAALPAAHVANALDKTISAHDTVTRKQTKIVTALGHFGAAAVVRSITTCASSPNGGPSRTATTARLSCQERST